MSGPSLDLRGRGARLIFGLAGVGVAAWISFSGLPRSSRLLLFPLLAAGFLGLVQAAAGT